MKVHIIYLLIFLTTSVFSKELPLGSLEFEKDGKKYSFENITKAAIRNLAGKTEVMIGLEDRTQKVELILLALVPKDSQINEHRLDSRYHDIKFIFKTPEHSFYIEPEYLILDENHSFPDKQTVKNLSRIQRIKKGIGVIHNKGMSGTIFYLHLKPTVEDNIVKEISGSFSAITNVPSKKGNHTKTINHGKFNAGVIQ